MRLCTNLPQTIAGWQDLDPGDEDRRPDGPWCSRCGDAYDGHERDCPDPAPGLPYKECGRGGHMFNLEDRPEAR